jgi:hypothetical protein
VAIDAKNVMIGFPGGRVKLRKKTIYLELMIKGRVWDPKVNSIGTKTHLSYVLMIS